MDEILNILSNSIKKHTSINIEKENNRNIYLVTFDNYYKGSLNLKNLEAIKHNLTIDKMRLELEYYYSPPFFRTWPRYELLAIEQVEDIFESVYKRFS